MVSKKLLIGVPVIIVVAAGLWMLLGGSKPPVDVYARATPSITTDPASLLPESVAGLTRIDVEDFSVLNIKDFVGYYEGDVYIVIQKFSSASLATEYLDNYGETIEGSTRTTVSSGKVQWCTVKGSDQCYFFWRKGNWVFGISAPTETLRDRVAEGLTF